MSWKTLLKMEIDYGFMLTEKLFDMVEDDKLDWKPMQENNWMTMGQLLQHLSFSCGAGFKGFVTGDWGIPVEVMENMKPDEMLPPAEKMESAASVAEAKKLLEEDKQLAYKILEGVSEEDLNTKKAPAPWDKLDYILGHRCLQMTQHLNSHRHQLYYYLKLMGKPVNTSHLWA